MGYTKKVCYINDKIEVEKYYPGRYGAPGMPREDKRKKTPEEMAKQNFWKKCRYLRRTMELNFKGGDLHVTLTCQLEKRPTVEKAPKVIRDFRDKMARAYKKQGWEFKYIITCETGLRGAVHWHMICNNLQSDKANTWDIIRKNWNRGRPYFVPLDEDREYGRLAEYIVKEHRRKTEKEETLEKLSYMCSRNLIRPVEKKEKVDAKSWRRIPKAPEGYYLVKGSLINEINKYTGMPYQKYTVKRLEEAEPAGIKKKRKGGRSGGT